MNLPEKQTQTLALEVSKGCNGAAQRFIRIQNTLSFAGLDGKNSVQEGLDFSRRTDAEVDTFLLVFKTAFAQDSLDLDLRSSLVMAKSLTQEFSGDSRAAREDFVKLVDYCSGENSLNLPRPACGSFAARVSKFGQQWEGGGLSRTFIRTFEFIRAENGVRLPTARALEIAEKLVATGPDSPDNFISAYRYGISKNGLELDESAALAFAMKMSAAPAAPASSK